MHCITVLDFIWVYLILFKINHIGRCLENISGDVVNSEVHQELLIRNLDDDILSFPAMAGKRVAVIGLHYNSFDNLLLEYA